MSPIIPAVILGFMLAPRVLKKYFPRYFYTPGSPPLVYYVHSHTLNYLYMLYSRRICRFVRTYGACSKVTYLDMLECFRGPCRHHRHLRNDSCRTTAVHEASTSPSFSTYCIEVLQEAVFEENLMSDRTYGACSIFPAVRYTTHEAGSLKPIIM